MSNDIKQISHLPPETVYRIKSSQVITSVFAALKELVENALDSGASVLNVRLEGYGLNLIEVKDNGHGISESDLSKVCLPHTTSKIVQFSDLECLSTYGFRGEALSALCQLASVSITSKTRSCSVGRSCCFSSDGKMTSSKGTACNVGTCVTVSQLFQPMPVRLKFHSDARRKKEQLKKVEELLMAYSVARPALHVTLTHDRQVLYHKSAAANTHQCLHAVFKDCATSLTNVCRTTDQLTISVFLPRPSKTDLELISSSREASLKNKKKAPTLPPYCRSAPDKLFILVNDRPVYHKELEKRVKLFFTSCHENFGGRWPAGVIMLKLPTDAIDVNLEPSKDRVIISGEDAVLELLTEILTEIYGPVKEALPKPHLGKQPSEENEDQDCMNKENVNSSPEISFSTNTAATRSSFPNHSFGNSSVVRSSDGVGPAASSCKNIANELVGVNTSRTVAVTSDLTADERNILEEILSQDIVSHDPGVSSVAPASNTLPGNSFSSSTLLDKPVARLHSGEAEGIFSSDQSGISSSPLDDNVKHVPVLQISSSSETSDGNNDNAGPQSTLLRGVSEDIDAVAWSKGQILGDSGANIQSVRVLSTDPRGCRRTLNGSCTESPAKRLKISLDDVSDPYEANSFTHTECEPPLESLMNKNTVASNSEKHAAPKETIEEPTSITQRVNSVNPSHSSPSVLITPLNNTSAAQSKTQNSNSGSGFGESSKNVLIRHPLQTGCDAPAVRSPRIDVPVSSSNGSSSNNNDASLSQSRASDVPFRSQDTPRRPETSADRAACRTVMGTTTTERLPHGGHLVSKPITAFAAFAKRIRSDVLRELAGADFTVVGKEIAARWKALGAEDRREFEELADNDIVRYNCEIRELRQRQCVSGKTGSPLRTMDRFVSPVARKSLDSRGNGASNGRSGSAISAKNSAPAGAACVDKSNKANQKPWQSRSITADVSLSRIKSLLVARSKKNSSPATFRMVGRLHYPSLPSGERGVASTNDEPAARGDNCEEGSCDGQLSSSRNDIPSNSADAQIESTDTQRHRGDTDTQIKSLRNSTPLGPAHTPASDCSSHPQEQMTSNNTLCWVCVDPNARIVYGIRSSALCELLLCYRLLESYSLPAKPLVDPVPFNESTLVHWGALLQLTRRPGEGHDLVTDRRLTSSGLEVALYRDGSTITHGELVAVANNVGFYGINDLQEVLSYITRNPDATLMQTRPDKLRHWIQAESVRISRSSPEADDHEDVEEKLRQWHQYSLKYSPAVGCSSSGSSSGVSSSYDVPSFLPWANTQDVRLKGDTPLPVPGLPNPEVCLHHKPILHVLYDLDELPGSQSQRSRCSQDVI